MRVHVIGLGGAGGRIVDRLAGDHEDESFCHGINAFDTDGAALGSLERLEGNRRYRFGDAAGGEGLHGDLHAGRRLGDAHASEITRVLDDQRPSVAEAFLLVVGLGGGAGAGMTPALAEELDRLYSVPTYVFGVLPAPSETKPRPNASSRGGSARTSTKAQADRTAPARPLAERNAARTLDALSTRADAVFPFDPDPWIRSGEDLTDATPRIEAAIVTAIAGLFGTGEAIEGATPQRIIDASDVARVVGSDGEIAAIGHAAQPVETPDAKSRFGFGLFGSSDPVTIDTGEAVSAIRTVIRKAARGKGTVEVPDGRANRTLLAVGGPPAWLNRKAIADGGRWLAEETGSDAVLSGDAPDPAAEAVSAVVLRSGIAEPTRVAEIRATID